MGVPKFFRYISERYPCLSELAREQYIPDIDNFYLDMNGIIHNCSHPDDSNINLNITEDEMFKDIFNYVDKLFFLIKPRKLLFMAVDGVAPRAKMNQQRSRRFRKAKEVETQEKLAKMRGEVIEHERFDSNCITAGTEFMDRLHEALRYFIKSKISADPLWQNCCVILSGHNSPGEGEHKIMDYIRYLKSQSDFNPNTRHCLYGLDADLIILGLCTHELNFVILREEVKFGKNTKHTSVEETRFFLTHLGLLREYLELEFEEIKEDQNFDIAKLIDDWILMGFMVGNDFIPHLPCMHRLSNALPLLYNTYKKIYSSLGGNINESGKLNLPRLEKYFEALSEVEFQIFQENQADLKYFEAKQSKNGIDEAFDFDVSEINNENTDNDLAALIESSRQFLDDDDDENLSDNEQHINDEFENYKRNYYMNKLNKDHSKSEHTREQTICYIRALQWVLDYYYRGVQSWDWYYPHHYAPFISDLKGFKDYEIKFNMSKPFLPFQQLLAVLPAASRNLLPKAYHELMTNASSELIDYYPEDFQTDLNGKQHEWEAIVLIPFIDEKRLLDAMVECDKNLTPSERKRNQHGPMLKYNYHPQSQGQAPGIYSLKPLQSVFCTEKPFWYQDILISSEKTVCVELPNADRKAFFSGFPSMKHLNYKFEVKNTHIKVFDYPSREESFILQPESRNNLKDIYTVAEKYLNQVIFIGWPYLIKAKVVGVSNGEKYIDNEGIRDAENKFFNFHVKATEKHIATRMGIEFSDYSVMVYVRTYVGHSYVCGFQGKVSITEFWSDKVIAYPAQGVVSHIPVHATSISRHRKIEELFPANSKIFFIGNPYYGSEGVVLNPMLVYECGRLKVNITVLPEPDITEAKDVQSQLKNDYVNCYEAASQLGIHVKTLCRIMASVLIVKGARRPKSNISENVSKLNIGLQLKHFKQQDDLDGYSKFVDNQWLLSSKAIALICEYVRKFPVVIDYLSKVPGRNEIIFEEDLFPEHVGENKVEEIVSWLKEQDHAKAERVACGSKMVEKESVEKILEAIEKLKFLPVKTVKLQVKPHLLLKPDVILSVTHKSKRAIQLFDRVVIVKTTYMVPLGSKGTIIGICPVRDPNPVRLECNKSVENFYRVLFDKCIPNGNGIYGIAPQRVYKVPESSVLLLMTQDNNKQSDSCYDSKASKRLEDEKFEGSSIIRSCKETNLPTNSGTNVSNALNDKKDAITPTQILSKGNDNFWLPRTNTIKIMHNLNHSTQLSQSNNSQQRILPQECNDGTKLLKSILGLSANQTSVTDEPAVSIKPQLPQPPTSWRVDAQKVPVVSPLSKEENIANKANQLMTSKQVKMPIHKQSQFQQGKQISQPQQISQQQLQNSISQNKPFSLNSLNQKGAFIPLQVTRGNSSFTNNIHSTTASSSNTLTHQDVNLPNLNQLSLNGNEGNKLKQGDESKIIHNRKKRQRVPKIGARFDNAQEK